MGVVTMSIVAYIQADLEKNPFLTKKILNKPVIEHTLDKVFGIPEIDNVTMVLYQYRANYHLNYLKDKYSKLQIYFSKEQNAGKRMLEPYKYTKPSAILRFAGDQIFFDIDKTREMIDILLKDNIDILYHNLDNGLLPEILTYDALEKSQIEIGKFHRFLKFLNTNPHSLSLKKIEHPWETPFYSFYIRSEREYHIANEILSYNLDYTKLNIYGDLLFGDTGLYEEGWFKSFLTKKSINSWEEPIPWMTYPAIDFLEKRLKKDFKVFEFGCGYSTLWWAKKVATVTACEHNSSWADTIKQHSLENVKIIYVDLSKEDYPKSILKTGEKYHIIVIDSRDRVNCAKTAVNSLLPDGIIIWDDSQRTKDNEGKEYILSQGFKKIEFTGMGPIVKDKNETTIFYRDGNCLGI